MPSEGLLDFRVGSEQSETGPGRRSAGFYNPGMAYSRDISIAVFNAFRSELRRDPPRILDGLCGAGVRGLRLALESPPVHVHLNDASTSSANLTKVNALENGISAVVTSRPFYRCFADPPYDYVDIDPYGTPTPYVVPALKCIARRGLLGVSATDTATLVGNYPEALKRRYMVEGVPLEPNHEVGLRILMGYVVRQAASLDKSAHPLLSYQRGHHFRIFFEVKDGAERADALLEKMGYASRKTPFWTLEDSGNVGPLWAGKLGSAEFASQLTFTDVMPAKKDLVRDQKSWKTEYSVERMHYDMAEVASHLKRNMPGMDAILEKLRSEGFLAERSLFGPTKVSTNADFDKLVSFFRQI